MNIFKIADYILKYFSKKSNGISHLKLQKLLYYVKVWSLIDGKNIVKEPFHHWTYGPVNKDIWDKYKHYKNTPIDEPIKDVVLDNEDKSVIDFVVDNYIDYNAVILSAMTHQEDPWKNTPKDEIISEKMIVDYYSQQKFAKNFPLNPNKPFYSLMTDYDHLFIFDMNEEDAESSTVFNSYDEYKKLKDSAKNPKYWLASIG